jgi:hypothetical protein
VEVTAGELLNIFSAILSNTASRTVMAFIIVGGLLFGFPWQGCVDHPM